MGQGIMLSGAEKEVDFFIHEVFQYKIGDNVLYITRSHVCLLIVMLILIIFCIVAGKKLKKAQEIPSGFQNVLELVMEFIDGLINGVMGKFSPKFRNYMATLFVFIFFSNISGLLGLRPPTADYGVTLGLALISFTLIHFNKFKHQKPKGVLKGLMDPWPIWMPINLIGDFAVPISLSLRLFANILSGTAIMALIYTLLGKIAVIWPAALHVYFDLFSGAIQTYVFCMLTMTYITDACTTEEA
ncbi:MAG: F0F1 ATP synthase subunit A [Lachnospiraceae bacterium]|nr:F0F1 ATP synthase subunit A [Lachnospiraceae bacterium]